MTRTSMPYRGTERPGFGAHRDLRHMSRPPGVARSSLPYGRGSDGEPVHDVPVLIGQPVFKTIGSTVMTSPVPSRL